MSLRSLVWKEVMDLIRDPRLVFGLIVLPLILFGVMGGVTRYMMEEASREASPSSMKIGVVDLDSTELSRALYSYLSRMTASTVPMEDGDPGELVSEARRAGLSGVVVIPPGFGGNITAGIPARVEVYTYIRELSMAETGRISALQGLVESFSQVIRAMEAERLNVSAGYLSDPLRLDFKAFVGDKGFTASQAEALTGILFTVVYAPLLVVGYAASISVSTIGVEKEEHTLEVLLTLPIKRSNIVTAKLVGGLVVSVIASLSTLTGFYVYTSSIISGSGSSSGGIGVSAILPRDPLTLSITMLSLLSTIIGVTLLAMLLGSLGRDVRSSQGLAGIVWAMVFSVGYLLAAVNMYGLPTPARYALASLPTAAPVIAVKLLFTGDTVLPLYSMAAQLGWSMLFYHLFSRVLESEMLVTGTVLHGLVFWKKMVSKLNLGRR